MIGTGVVRTCFQGDQSGEILTFRYKGRLVFSEDVGIYLLYLFFALQRDVVCLKFAVPLKSEPNQGPADH